jgi:hypothetical protein
MGPITDHTKEHLGPGDRMIARTRRRALQAARAFAAGTPAPGVDDPQVMLDARSGFFETLSSVAWEQAYVTKVQDADRVFHPQAKPAPVPQTTP